VAAMAISVLLRRRLDPWVKWGILFSFMNLLPVSGLVPFGYMSHSYVADHFVYLPMLGAAVLIAYVVEAVFRRVDERSVLGRVVIVGLYLWIGALGLASIRQTAVWKDPSTMWEAVLAVNKTSFAAYNNYGMTATKAGDFDKAVAMFQECSKLAPKLDKPYFNMGEAYRLKGDDEAARKSYVRALDLNPGHEHARLSLIRLLRKQGRGVEARSYLETSVKELPGSAPLRTEFALVLYDEGSIDTALQELRVARSHDPTYPEPYLYESEILMSRNDVDAAIALLRKALSLFEDPRARNVLGAALAEKGLLPEALKQFLRAYEANPGMPGLADNTANAYLDMNNRAAAEAFCRQAAEDGGGCAGETLIRIRQGPAGGKP
ncbi:MAG: tetratricopeptide repeat protein, partial [Pseudomonadota bacterium]